MDVSAERRHADIFAGQSLNPQEFQLWEMCRSAHRFMAFRGKELVVYRLFMGKPEIQTILTCQTASLSLQGGLRSEWKDSDDNVIVASHSPVMVADSVFLWHVFDNQIQYLPYNGKFSVRLPLAYRCKEHPKNETDGITYILERAVFDSTFGAK